MGKQDQIGGILMTPDDGMVPCDSRRDDVDPLGMAQTLQKLMRL